MSRVPFYLLVGTLLLAGIVLTAYRHVHSDVPLTPGEQRQIWEVEAQVNFTALGEAVKVDLALPSHQPGFRILTENTASSGYGLSFLENDNGRRAQWAIRQAVGPQQLYYSAQFLATEGNESLKAPLPALQEDIVWEHPYDTAAAAVIRQAYERSADSYTFTRELIREFGENRQGENARLLLTQYARPDLLIRLLNEAKVRSRLVYGLMLEDGRRRQALTPWLQVFEGDRWVLINPETGEQGRPDNLLLWGASGQAVLEVQGGTNSRVTFSIIRHSEPASVAVRNQLVDSTLINFSIHSLPLEEQALFKTILLIPIGALVVVLLRVLVGLKTSGTFMPVLIALAFIQTTLFTGLIGFLLIVSVGLVIRSYLSRLNLLLVARVSAVIITVIAIISIFSVMAYRFGLNAGLTITFFPMIILSWTIERMSILWEEEGPKEVIKQGGGSLLTAVLAYLAMNNPWVRHITFNFLGVQMILMAFILLLGNYTGYRLLELRRFKPLAED
ncbi:inactive transglutaminase family protein [Halomonas shantousis]